MLFVGREREIGRITRELANDNHVIVTGPYGTGRTSLLRRIAATTTDRWRLVFLDFENDAAQVARTLFVQLFPRRGTDRLARELRYSGIRFRLARWATEDSRRHVLVLDNIAALSSRKLALIRDLATSKRYGLVAIVETFLPGPELERLRSRLANARLVTLGRLSYETTRSYFTLASERYHLGWSPERIAATARATRGYPLGMWQAIAGGVIRAENERLGVGSKRDARRPEEL